MRLLVFFLLAVGLVWIVIMHGFAAYLARVDPEAALRLQAENPTALLSLASSELRLQQTTPSAETDGPATEDEPDEPNGPDEPLSARPGQNGMRGDEALSAPSLSPAAIRARAERALVNDPLSSRALSVLGQVADGAQETKALMEAAVRRSVHERAAAYWMMRRSYEENKLNDALRYADLLLRSRPQAMPYVVPVLGRIAELDEGKHALNALLATNPPWRSSFFGQLPNVVADARTPLGLLSALNGTSVPASAHDIRSYVSFLINHKFYDLAYYVWLQFMPPSQLSHASHLFNGGFETPSSGVPFDWSFSNTGGAFVKIAQPLPDTSGEHAMFLEFGPGRVDFKGVRQMILLAPGRYRFRGRQKLDILSQRGLRWEVRCVDDEIIGQSADFKGTQAEWSAFEFSFSVPRKNCPAQTVHLRFDARSASEQFISGTVWYDDLEIERDTDPQPGITPARSGATNHSEK